MFASFTWVDVSARSYFQTQIIFLSRNQIALLKKITLNFNFEVKSRHSSFFFHFASLFDIASNFRVWTESDADQRTRALFYLRKHFSDSRIMFDSDKQSIDCNMHTYPFAISADIVIMLAQVISEKEKNKLLHLFVNYDWDNWRNIKEAHREVLISNLNDFIAVYTAKAHGVNS